MAYNRRNNKFNSNGSFHPYEQQKPESSYNNNDNSYGPIRGGRGGEEEEEEGGGYRNKLLDNLGANLKEKDWSKISLAVFEKNFYKEAESVKNIPKSEVENWRKENNIVVKGNNIPNPIRTFEEAGFPEYLMREIRNANFKAPTSIQAQGWPMALSGRDVIGIASTGSGKTLAFLLPSIIHINAQPKLGNTDGPITLIIVPTRELAIQIETEANKFIKHSRVSYGSVYGGVPRKQQYRSLCSGISLCICTPGRLIDFVENDVTNLHRVTYLVLDEADRMLDMGFEIQLKKILSQIRNDRQILMWSATWPFQVQALAKSFMNHDTIQVTIGQSPNGNAEYGYGYSNNGEVCYANKDVKQVVCIENHANKYTKLVQIITQHLNGLHIEEEQQHKQDITQDKKNAKQIPENSEENSIAHSHKENHKANGIAYKENNNENVAKKILIFTSTKRMCDELSYQLREQWNVSCLHGDKAQSEREHALNTFKKGRSSIMVATDVAARGIHVDDISLVVNYDFPTNIEDYVHRIGRTARCGKKGTAISIITRQDSKFVPKLVKILKEAKQHVSDELSSLCYQGRGGGGGGFRGYGRDYRRSYY